MSQSKQLANCGILLSTYPLTFTSHRGTQSNASYYRPTSVPSPYGGPGTQPPGGPTAVKGANASASTKMTDLQWSARTFVDEVNEDLVLIDGGEVFFSKASLVAHPDAAKAAARIAPETARGMDGFRESRGSFDSEPDVGGRSVDVAHLKTASKAIIAASRTTNLDGRTFVAALHEDTRLNFYTLVGNHHGVPAASASRSGIVESFGNYQPGGKTLTGFGSKEGVIRFFAWLPDNTPSAAVIRLLRSAAMQSPAPSNLTERDRSTNGSPSPAGSASTAYCLVVSQAQIAVLAVKFANGHGNVSVLASVRTTCDHVQYNVQKQFLVVLNAARPTTAKCFVIGKPGADAIRKLPEFPVDQPDSTVAVSTYSHLMQPPLLEHRLMQPIVLYDLVFVVEAACAKNELHLYQWLDNPNDPEHIGSFQRRYILVLPEESWPVQLQVVDNVLLVHQKGRGRLVMTYDIKLQPPKELMDKYSGAAVAPSRQSSSGTPVKAGPPGSQGETSRSGRIAVPVCSIRTNVTRRKGLPKEVHSDPAAMGLRSLRTEGDPVEDDAAVPSGSADPHSHAATVGWGQSAFNLATSAASTAWSALFSVSWGPTTPTVSAPALAYIFPAMFPLPVQVMDLWFEPPLVDGEPTAVANSSPRSTFAAACNGNVNQAVRDELEFYQGYSLPLALNRSTGEVNLVLFHPAALSAVFGDRCLSTQFLINRTGLGGDIIPLRIRDMTHRREPLHVLGVIFGIISQHSFEYSTRIVRERAANVTKTSRKRAPKPFGYPSVSDMKMVGQDIRRLHEIFPMCDTQQDQGRKIFRYEDAVWPFRGISDHPLKHTVLAPLPASAGGKLPSGKEGESSQSFLGHLERDPSTIAFTVASEQRLASTERYLAPPPGALDQHRLCPHVLLPLFEYGHSLLANATTDSATATDEGSNGSRSETPLSTTGGSAGGASPTGPFSISGMAGTPGSPVTPKQLQIAAAADYFQHFLFVVLEYCRTLRQHEQVFSPMLQSILLDTFAELSQLGCPQYYRLQQLLMYKAIEPTQTVALKLVSISAKYPPAFQHALDMLNRLGENVQIVNLLLAQRLPLRAASFALEFEVKGFSVIEMLECAKKVDGEEIRFQAEEKLERVGDTGERGTFVIVYMLMQRYLSQVLPDPTDSRRPSAVEMEPYRQFYQLRCDFRQLPCLV